MRSLTGLYQFCGQDAPENASNPALAGACLTFTTAQVAPSQGAFNFALVHQALAPWRKVGKQGILRMVPSNPLAYNASPHWMGTAGHATPDWFYQSGAHSVVESEGSVLPVVWDAVYQRELALVVAEFARQFDGHAAVAAIEIGVAFDGETTLDGVANPQKLALWQAAGYSAATYLEAIGAIVDSYRRAFTKTPLALMVNERHSFPDDAATGQDILTAAYRPGLWLANNGLCVAQTLDGAAWGEAPGVILEPLHGAKHLASQTGETLLATLERGLALGASHLLVFATDVSDPANAATLNQVAALAQHTLATPALPVARLETMAATLGITTTEILCAGTLWAESEFQAGLTGACGPNALAMAESWAQQSYVGTVALQQRMHAAGRCDANGVSALSALAAQAQSDGYRIAASLCYQNPLATSSWESLLAQFAGVNCAVVMEVSNGQALVDYLSGQGEDAVGLQFHFICVLGANSGGVSPHAGGKTLPAGYWVADGDNNLMNPVVGGVRERVIAGHTLVYYPLSVLAAARPVGALAILARGATTMGVPSGWTDDGATGTLTAPNKQVVAHGFRDFVLAYPGGWESDNWPLAAEYYRDASSGGIEPGNKYIGRGSRQDFRYRSLGCPQNADGTWKPVYRIWTGQDIVALEKSLNSAQSALTTSESALSAAQGQITALQAQIAQLQQQIAAGGDATAHTAIVALASALSALSSASSKAAA